VKPPKKPLKNKMEIPASAPPLVEMAAPVIVDSVAPVIVDSAASVVIDAPAPVEPVALDGGAKKKSKRSKSMSKKSRSRKSRKSPTRGKGKMLKGGEFGYDAFGDLDLGRFPAKKNLPYSGLSRNEDYDAIKKNLKNPLYKLAEDSYMQLHKLYMQMSKTRMSEKNKLRLLEEVKSHNEDIHFQDGEEPEWFSVYVAEIDKKIEEAEQAVHDKDKKYASLEYQAAIEEKKLAYMIMEYLSGVAVGSGERARTWRSDRTRTGEPGSLERTYERKSDHSVVERALAAKQAEVATQVQERAAEIRAAAAAAAANAAPPAAAAAAAADQAAAAAPAAGVLGAVAAVQSLLGLGGPAQPPLPVGSASPANALNGFGGPGQPPINVGSASPALSPRALGQYVLSGSPAPPRRVLALPPALPPRRGDAVIDLTSGSPIDLTSGSPIDLTSGSPASPPRPRTRANPGSGLNPGLRGGAKKRSSRSRKGKSRSRSHKKAKKHSM